MVESSTHRAIHQLVDRAAGALFSRRSLVRSTLTGSAAIYPRLDQAGAWSQSRSADCNSPMSARAQQRLFSASASFGLRRRV